MRPQGSCSKREPNPTPRRLRPHPPAHLRPRDRRRRDGPPPPRPRRQRKCHGPLRRHTDSPVGLARVRGPGDLFLDRGARTPIDGREGRQLIEYLVKKGLPRLFAVLEANGADFTETTETGWTKLHLAALGGLAEICETLLELGLDPNGQDMYGYAPAHYAAKRARRGHSASSSKGAFLEVVTLAGDTPWNIAEKWHHETTAGILVEAGAPASPPQFPVLKAKYLGQ